MTENPIDDALFEKRVGFSVIDSSHSEDIFAIKSEACLLDISEDTKTWLINELALNGFDVSMDELSSDIAAGVRALA